MSTGIIVRVVYPINIDGYGDLLLQSQNACLLEREGYWLERRNTMKAVRSDSKCEEETRKILEFCGTLLHTYALWDSNLGMIIRTHSHTVELGLNPESPLKNHSGNPQALDLTHPALSIPQVLALVLGYLAPYSLHN